MARGGFTLIVPVLLLHCGTSALASDRPGPSCRAELLKLVRLYTIPSIDSGLHKKLLQGIPDEELRIRAGAGAGGPAGVPERIRAANEFLLDFERFLPNLGSNPYRTTQDSVWAVHANYTRVKEAVEHWRRDPSLSGSMLAEVESTLARLEASLAANRTFEKLEDAKLTLVPKANQTVKTLLPQDVFQAIETMRFDVETLRTALFTLRQMDSHFPSRFRRALANGAERRRVSEVGAQSLNAINRDLLEPVTKLGDSAKLASYDLEPIRLLLDHMDAVLHSSSYRECQAQNLRSIFPETRRLAREAAREEAEYRKLREAIFGRDRPKLRPVN